MRNNPSYRALKNLKQDIERCQLNNCYLFALKDEYHLTYTVSINDKKESIIINLKEEGDLIRITMKSIFNELKKEVSCNFLFQELGKIYKYFMVDFQSSCLDLNRIYLQSCLSIFNDEISISENGFRTLNNKKQLTFDSIGYSVENPLINSNIECLFNDTICEVIISNSISKGLLFSEHLLYKVLSVSEWQKKLLMALSELKIELEN